MELSVLDFRRKGFDVEELNYQNRLAINQSILQEIAENPIAIINKEPVDKLSEATIEDIKNFIRAKRTTLWLSFSVSSEKGLEKAAESFKRELDQFNAFLDGNSSG